MLEIIKAIIYGIVEGITEWLPISSTGHLILVERLIPFQETSEGFFDMFDVGSYPGGSRSVLEQDLAFLYEEKSTDKKRWYCKI